jgi:DNA polymerase IV
MEIKQRIRDEIGDFLKVSIGVGTNRFLAKTGAELHKPDGLDVITHENLLEIYKSLKLIDLCGINSRFAARLNAEGIFTPLDFYNANQPTLKKVFKSILGYYWFLRLRGYEIDDFKSPTRSIGNDYALYIPTDDKRELARFFLKLSEKTGRRLRRKGLSAYGIHAAFIYEDWTFWHKGKTFDRSFFTTSDIFKKVMLLAGYQPVHKKISKISIACYSLAENSRSQLDLFEEDRGEKLQDAMDEINDRYGEFVVSPALMMGMNDLVLDRIAFGGVKEMNEIYGTRL